MRRTAFALALIAFVAGAAAAGEARIGPASGLPVPRFESLMDGAINARRGPSTDHDRIWIYDAGGLPLEIIEEAGAWRRVRDPDGEVVWMHQANLSSRRTAMVGAGKPLALLARPRAVGQVRARLAPGVIVALLRCEGEWRRVKVQGRTGWAPAERLIGGEDCRGLEPANG
jgi:SH3-like domain-containing protein